MKKLIAIIIFLFCVKFGNSQQVLLSQDVLKDTIAPTKGQNRKNFSHLYIGAGCIFGEMKGLKPSLDFRTGFRYKRKFSQVFSGGIDLYYEKNTFYLDAIKSVKMKTVLNKVNGGMYFRLNYGRRGDKVGNFVDIGGSGGYVFKNAHYQIYDSSVKDGAKLIQKYIGSDFYSDFAYSAICRIGFGRYVFYGDYRLSSVFDASLKKSPDYPKFTAGLQIGLHR